MIRYLKRNQLDVIKYDNCIKLSLNSRIYAFSWYLDIVADNWDALVLNDYEAVMPITYLKTKRNLFFKKILQPPFCQQLGVFFLQELSKEDFELFLDNFIKLLPKQYNFNSMNFIGEPAVKKSIEERKNYELILSNDYNIIYKSYSNNLKRTIVKAEKNQLEISNDVTLKNLISIKKQTAKHKISSKNIEKFENLVNELKFRKIGSIYGVYVKDELISAAFFTNYNGRLIHLFSATSEKGKKYGATSFLFDYLIKENINNCLIFDFEGSMISGVANFFKSFGAVSQNYHCYTNS